MRVAAVFLLVASTAAAQAPLFPGGAGPLQAAAPHWRASASGGLSGALTGVAALGLERTVAGPFSVGGRGVLYTSGGFVDDGGSTRGAAVDVLGSVSTRDRILDARAFAGAGASVVRVSSGSFVLDDGPQPDVREATFRPHLVAGAGLDLYPFAGVGVGVEARGVLSPAGAALSTVAVGLRVRLAR